MSAQAGNVTIVYPDAGESASDFLFERTLFIGSFLGCMAWGIQLIVYGSALYLYFSIPTSKRKQRSNYLSWIILILYMTTIFALSTTYIGTNIQANVDMYITHRNDPGGPLVYVISTASKPLILVGNNICPVVAIFLTDALLIWRLHVIWGVYWIIILPILMLIASVVMGILLLYTSAKPGQFFNSASAVRFGTAYFSISLSLTVIVTLIIVFRLLYTQRRATKILGEQNSDDCYVSAWTILLESAAMYAVVGFIFLVLYNRNNPVSNIFTQLMVQVMCISSDLIVLRVIIGSAWTRQMSENMTSLIVFKTTPVHGHSSTQVDLEDQIQEGKVGGKTIN